MLTKMDHVGIVVKDINKALKLYGDMLRLTPTSLGIMTIKDVGVKAVLLPVGDNFIEFLEPIGTESRFAKHLKTRGEGLFHISLFTPDYSAEVKRLRAKGHKVEEEVTRDLFAGYAVKLAWLPPQETNGVWVEITDLASLPPNPGK